MNAGKQPQQENPQGVSGAMRATVRFPLLSGPGRIDPTCLESCAPAPGICSCRRASTGLPTEVLIISYTITQEMDTMDATYEALADRVRQQWTAAKARGQRRLIIAVSGPPGSGKTTIARHVVDLVKRSPTGPSIVAISADGFHLPLSTLRALPNATEALARRGAPWTFDGAAAADLVIRLRDRAGRGVVSAPTFDHAVKDPVEGGLSVASDVEVCIFEGNYLLCDEGPWSRIADEVDDRWLVRVDAELARQRVAARHLKAGIENTMADALKRAQENDMVNGEYVMKHSFGRYDVLVESIEEHNGKP